MRTLCMGNAWATVHVTSLCCGFNSFLWLQRQLAICREVGRPHEDMRTGHNADIRTNKLKRVVCDEMYAQELERYRTCDFVERSRRRPVGRAGGPSRVRTSGLGRAAVVGQTGRLRLRDCETVGCESRSTFYSR